MSNTTTQSVSETPAERHSRELASIAFAKLEICHLCDGPITSFVLMARATKCAAKGQYSADVCANALAEALEEHFGISIS